MRNQEFIELKECYDDLCILERDPKQRIAVNCYTCIRGMDLSKKYGKQKNNQDLFASYITKNNQ